jgi:hypothetical protein
MRKSIFAVSVMTVLLLTACSSNGVFRGATLTPNPTALFRRTEFVVRQTVEALGTPWPPYIQSTPIPKSPFEECATSGLGVRYVIEGSGVTAMSITQQNDKNGTDQGDYRIPYCRLFRGFQPGDFVYISAQIIQPTSGAGSITCKIYSGNTVIAQATASGFASIATCSGRLP